MGVEYIKPRCVDGAADGQRSGQSSRQSGFAQGLADGELPGVVGDHVRAFCGAVGVVDDGVVALLLALGEPGVQFVEADGFAAEGDLPQAVQ